MGACSKCNKPDLDAAAAKHLASCWATASSVVGFRQVVVDLTNLSALDDPGRDLLEALHREGVEFLARSEFQNRLVSEITGAARKPNPAYPGARGRRLNSDAAQA
jgi:hypothetical protein